MKELITFPEYNNVRCLMMPYIQGDPDSLPPQYKDYAEIVESLYFQKGDIGYLTIDESPAYQGFPHRGERSKTNRAIHTEAGLLTDGLYAWGAPTHPWGGDVNVTLDKDTKILIANNMDYSCAVWDDWHEETTPDGDIGRYADLYPYSDAYFMKSGEVREIGILTPHESLPVKSNHHRQFLRIISSGVHGMEPYFTRNPLLPHID